MFYNNNIIKILSAISIKMEVKTLKKIICIALAAMMICGLFVGCGSPTNTPTNTPTQDPGTQTPEPTEYVFQTDELIELDYWIGWASGDAYDGIMHAVNDFNSLYEGQIKVTAEYNAGGNSSILTAYKAQILPEVFVLYFAYQANYHYQGVSIDVLPYARRTGFDFDDFQDCFWVHLTYEDHVTGLPVAPSGILLVRNLDMYQDKLGHTKAPTTLDELMDYSKKLTVVEGGETKVYGYTFDRSDGTWIGTLGRCFGATWYGDLCVGCPAAYDGTAKKAFQYIRDFVDSGAFYQPATAGTAMANVSALNSGAVAQICTFVSRILTIFSMETEYEYAVSTMPGLTADQTGYQEIGGRANSISSLATEKQKEAAWLFIEYCVSPEQEIKWGTTTAYVVRRTSSGQLPEMIAHWEKNPHFYPSYQLLMTCDAYAYPLNLNQFSSDRNSIVDQIIYEGMTAAQAEALLRQSAEDYLTEERPVSVFPTTAK